MFDHKNPIQRIKELEEEHSIVVSAEKPTTGEKVWFRKAKNLFNASNIIQSKYLDTNGDMGNSTSSNLSGYIQITPNTVYKIRFEFEVLAAEGTRCYCFYDESQNYISGGNYASNSTTKSLTIVSPANAKYVMITLDKNYKNIKLSENVEGIYGRDDNGDYEKFKTKEEIERVNVFTANNGFTILNQNICKQGKHYWGYLVVKKNSGYFNINQEDVANLNVPFSFSINFGCFLSNDQWKTKSVGYLFMSSVIKVSDDNNTNSNFAKIFVDFMEN